MRMTKAEAELELDLQIAEARVTNRDLIVIEAAKAGLPAEFATRLAELWDHTQEIGGKVWEIGKLVVARILDFIKVNPGLTVGIAIGAAVGALVASVPLLGAMLGPLATLIAVVFGIKEGVAMDGATANPNILSAAIYAAKEFLALLIDVVSIIVGKPQV